MSKLNISILGCGWLGKALGVILQEKADVVCGREISQDSDIIIIAVPPKGEYLEFLKTLTRKIDRDKYIILLSSTSVYPQEEGAVSEEDTEAIMIESKMLKAESIMIENFSHILVLRLGGLMGYGRIVGKYSAGKIVEKNTLTNYVHRDDVIRVIERSIEKKLSGVFNVVCSLHIPKKELFDYHALRYGFEKTIFNSLNPSGKIVSSQKLINILGEVFFHESMEDICDGTNVTY